MIARATSISVGLLAICLVFATQAHAGGGRDLFGVVSQAPLQTRDYDRMQRGGVRSLRVLVRWEAVQPQPGPFDFSSLDRVVEATAERDIELLPILYGSPPWINEDERRPPLDSDADRSAWRALLTALADRYGTGGEFWAQRDGRPVRRWQIWNEPNFSLYWSPRPDPAEYARLVRLSDGALRAADPKAETVLAGVAAVRSGMRWWKFLRRLYEVRGVRPSFDYVALHPYAPGIRLLVEQVELARRIMRNAGDRRTPLAITEVGWASHGDPAPLVVGARRQARLLDRAFATLDRGRSRWRLSDVQWYAWQDATAVEPFCNFCATAGLFDRAGRPKPAWSAFRRSAR